MCTVVTGICGVPRPDKLLEELAGHPKWAESVNSPQLRRGYVNLRNADIHRERIVERTKEGLAAYANEVRGRSAAFGRSALSLANGFSMGLKSSLSGGRYRVTGVFACGQMPDLILSATSSGTLLILICVKEEPYLLGSL